MASTADIQRIRTNATFHQYYDSIFIIVKNEVYRVFLWMYQGKSEYVGEYLKSQKIKGYFGSIEKDALRRKESPAKFDICFLYKLLQYTCGLADSQSHIWNKPETVQEKVSLEHSLYLLKEKRHQLSHDPEPLMTMTVDELENHLDNVQRLCERILREAGQKANRTSSEVDGLINKMRKNLDDIKTKSAPSGMTAQKFAILAKREMKRDHKPAPSSQNFFDLKIQSSGDGATYCRFLKQFPLWRCEDGSLPKAIVLRGKTGIGKTSVCRYIFNSWISGSTNIDELEEFHLVIPIQASSVSTRNVVYFLKSLITDTVLLCNEAEVLTFLQSLRILWLFDGLEEASKVAIDLMKEILSPANASHLIFLTTQSQDPSEVFSLLTDSLCVDILGLSEEGVQEFLQKKNLGDKHRDFLSEIQSLGNDLLKEIKNPLKLKMMVELWKNGELSEEAGASVYGLYKAITETHKEKLTQLLSRETKLNAKNISARVQSWIEVLCKTAYDMLICNEFVKINIGYQQLLKEKAESLIYPEYCLSVFLQTETAENNSSYTFVHNTQQIYLAAQYVCSLIKEKRMLPRKLKQLFRGKIDDQIRQSHHFLYLMLLQIVSGVARIGNDIEQRLIKDLVELLSTMKSNFNAFEVVRHANYNPSFREELGNFRDFKWTVFDHDVKAALLLLPFTKSLKSINVFIDRDPKSIHELPQLLEMISKRNLDVALSLYTHSNRRGFQGVSDDYLVDICSPNAKCHLRIFTGALSTDGVKFLKEMKELLHIYLRVFSNEVLHHILNNLKYLKRLEEIILILAMPVVTSPLLNLFQERLIELEIQIVNMDESKVKETADAIADISKQYEHIVVRNISANSAVHFVQRLQERNVQVENFQRVLTNDNMAGSFSVNYGAIPLAQPIDLFYQQWHNTRFETGRDDLGVERVRLSLSGIPKNRVMYCEGDSFRTLKTITFWKDFPIL